MNNNENNNENNEANINEVHLKEEEEEDSLEENYYISDSDSLYNIELDNKDKKYLLLDNELEELNNNSTSLLSKKSGLRAHIQEKLLKFYNQQRLLEHKLSEVKNNNTFVIILLLIFSSVLTLLEASKELYKYNSFGASMILSSIITFLSSFSKVMKHQETLEELVKSLEKCLITQVELKKVQENLLFCNNEKTFDEIKTNYLNNVYSSYLNCQMEIFKAVPKNQQKKIIQNIYNIDCSLRESYKNKVLKIKKIENEIKDNENIMINIKDEEINF